MNPEITHVNGVKVVSIPEFGGIAPVFVTPEKTLTVKGTGFSKDSAIAVIGVNEVGTQEINLTFNSLKAGLGISDLFGAIGETALGDLFEDIGEGLGDLFGDSGGDISQIIQKVNRRVDILRSPNVRFNSVDELKAYVPSLWEFQTTDLDLLGFTCRYERNAILLPFAICVYDFGSSMHSTPVIIAAMLPLPEVGEPKIQGEKVLIGAVPGPSSDRTDHFGKGGEVRWYDPKILTDLFSFNLDRFSVQPDTSPQSGTGIKELWDWLIGTVAKPGQAMMGEVFEELARIRGKGVPLKVHGWRNEGVLFDSPQTTVSGDPLPFGTAGFVIVWRDDLPSKPVPILNLGCNNKDQIKAMIQEAADKLWSFLPPLHTDKVLLPGQALTFGLQRLAQGMDNLLVRLLDSKHSGITVKFKFKVTGQDVAISKVSENTAVAIKPDEYSETIVPGTDSKSQFQIKFLATPDVVPEESPGAERYITVELFAEISLSSSCKFNDIRIGPPFTFKQLPLTLPTIAVFFTGPSCGNVPLIMLPDDTSLLPNDLRNRYWDITGMNPPPTKAGQEIQLADEIRIRVLSKLILLKDAVSLVKSVCNIEKPMLPWMDRLEGVLAHLTSGASAVIDTTGRIDDLGWRIYGKNSIGQAESFGRRIESALLIGFPPVKGGKRVRCFSGVNCSGHELKLEIPDGEYIAAFANLRKLDDKLQVGNIKLPSIKSTQNPAAPPLNWGGAIASIRFE